MNNSVVSNPKITPDSKIISGRLWKRLLVGFGAESCRFRCTYCFAGFDQYSRTQSLDDVLSLLPHLPNADILYPDCDGELFISPDWERVLHVLSDLSYSISISTKAHLTQAHLNACQQLDEALRRNDLCLKVGVSVSTKHSARLLEPGAPDYSLRIKTLGELRGAGLTNALVLRPLLADVPTIEYEEILLDARPFTDRVLVGDEWLNDTPRPFEKQPESLDSLVSEKVKWLPLEPTWQKRSVSGRLESLKAKALSMGYKFFDSDLSLMADVITERRFHGRH